MKTKTMVHGDLNRIMDIVSESFTNPWTREEMVLQLRQRTCLSTVVQKDNKTVGFLIYELNKQHFRIINFAVLPDYRRQGIGKRLVQNIITRLGDKTYIVSDVSETNLAAQLFLKSQGFAAVGVLRKFYPDGQDAYWFQYTQAPFIKVETSGNQTI